MKTLLLFLAALAICLPATAQSGPQVETALSNILFGTGRASGSIPVPYAGVSAGVIGLNGKLALKTDTDGNLIVTNPTNGFHFTLDLPTPSANRTISFPVGGGTVVTSPTTLEWQFTGATYNTVLTQVEPTVGDTVITLPDTANVDVALVLSTLTTNGLNAANSIWFASNSLVMEGATADAFETTVTPVDPTADQTWSIPNFAVNAAFVGSTLTTNNVDAANSVWGVSNGIRLEGATADTSETTVTLTDPTADRTITIPDGTGTVALNSSAVLTAGATPAFAPGSSVSMYTLTPAEGETIAATTTGAIAGRVYYIRVLTSGTSSYTLTFGSNFKSTGTLATGTADAKVFVIGFLYDGTNFCEVSRTTAQ